MDEQTPLDIAYAAMEAAPTDDTMRLKFFERVADGELFMLLDKEHEGDAPIEPLIFPVDDQNYILVFDREERLAAFSEGEAPYAALSGRVVCEMLDGAGIGLGLNLTVAPSEMFLPPEAISWLHETLGNAPEETEASMREIYPPADLPEALITALDQKLAMTSGLARFAYLAGASYDNGLRSHILAFVDHVPGSEDALAGLVSEALTFCGVEAGMLDVAFFKSTDFICGSLARFGLRFDLPEPEKATEVSAPGMDPAKPPRLI